MRGTQIFIEILRCRFYTDLQDRGFQDDNSEHFETVKRNQTQTHLFCKE